MMVYAYVHGIKQFRENELSIQKSVFKRLRVEHCTRSTSALAIDHEKLQIQTTSTGRPTSEATIKKRAKVSKTEDQS